VTSEESAEDRAEASAKALELAENCDWLKTVLVHHAAVEEGFAAVKVAQDAS
jgi:hypothetical protein